MLEKRTYSGSIEYFPKRKISNTKTRDLYGSWVCKGTFGNLLIRISGNLSGVSQFFSILRNPIIANRS
jgi:hypothetical protein